MKNYIKLVLGVCLAFITSSAVAQDVEMADAMRANGKIYVVVGIILLVLVGLFVYLFLLDRKVGKLENKLNEKPRAGH